MSKIPTWIREEMRERPRYTRAAYAIIGTGKGYVEINNVTGEKRLLKRENGKGFATIDQACEFSQAEHPGASVEICEMERID